MKLHLTTTDNAYGISTLRKISYPHTLLSFAYKGLEPYYASTFTRPDCEIILDSGAFTAWSIGKTVDINEYVKWATGFTIRNQSKLKRIRYINLDVIPGKKGRSASKAEISKSIVESMENANYLRACGIDAMEVFHQDEPFSLLKAIVERADGRLIAISPRNDVTLQQRLSWLKQVLSYCVKTFGIKGIPAAHGLAVTSETLVYAFPFYSVDSSSWTQCMRYGRGINWLPYMPRYKDKGSGAVFVCALESSASKYKTMAKNATNLWRQRGIVWDD